MSNFIARCLLVLLLVAPARAQMGLASLVQERLGETRPAPRAAGRVLDPVSLGAPPLVAARAPRTRFDLAVVLLAPRAAHATPVLAAVEDYWRARHFRLAPRPLVQQRIEELGLLTPDALSPQDYAQLGQLIGARYLVLVTVSADGARREFFGAGARLLGTGALFALRTDGPGDHHGAAPVIVTLAAVALVAGVTTRATCDLSSQLFDCAATRTVWLRSATATRRKVLFGLFADRPALAARARAAAVAKLYDGVAEKLKPGR